MAISKNYPLIKQAASYTTTGGLTLGSAATGYKAFSDYCADGDTVGYWLTRGSDWEYGRAVFTTGATEFVRTQLADSSGGGALTLASGDSITVSCAQLPIGQPAVLFFGRVESYDCPPATGGSTTYIDFNTATIEAGANRVNPSGNITVDTTAYTNARFTVTTSWPSTTGATYRRTNATYRMTEQATLSTPTATGYDITSGTFVTKTDNWDQLVIWVTHDATATASVDINLLVEGYW